MITVTQHVLTDPDRFHDELRRQFAPPRYRVFRSRYPAWACFAGSGRERVLYLLAGRCQLVVADETVQLVAGSSVRLPAGDYQQIGAEDPVDVAQVVDLERVRSAT